MKNLIFAALMIMTGSAFADNPLIDAAQIGNIEEVAMLLESGADVNARNENGWTALTQPIMDATLKGC